MATALVLILVMVAGVLAIVLIVNPRSLRNKLLSSTRAFVLRAQRFVERLRPSQTRKRGDDGSPTRVRESPTHLARSTSSGSVVSTDSRIEDEVRAALQRDARIKRPELIAVSVDEIGTVVLSGAVGSFPQHRAAVHDARQIDGVFEVIADDLKVHPPVGDRRADDEIRAAAMQQLIRDSRIRSNQIHVHVLLGQVTLTGYVGEESERVAASEDVERITGVVGVTNQIAVRAWRDATGALPALRSLSADDEIKARVMQRLNSDPKIRSDHIRVEVMDWYVTLTGYVGEESERAAAAEDAASVVEVIGVTNQIEVR